MTANTFNIVTRKSKTDKRRKIKNGGQRSDFAFRPQISVSIVFPFLIFCVLICALSICAAAQKIAVIAPENIGHSSKFAEKMRYSLRAKSNILDESLSETAFRSAAATAENPFNLSTDRAKSIGAAIGCEYFALVKSSNQRRSTYEKKDYYESFAAIYTVSARTGRLVFWRLQSYDAATEADAEKLLFASTDNLASEISEQLKAATVKEISEKQARKIEEVPAEDAPEAKNYRPPLPFKRIKPEYTRLAYVYDVTATVDVLIDVGSGGEIIAVEIARWAGFGLDESVAETVRKMNWRPAERNGKPLPTRVLLRYNFKRIEKEKFQ